MKKLAAVLISTAAVLGSASVAIADPIVVGPVGYLQVNEGGYVLLAEGNDNNGNALAGYIVVYNGGKACADDNGNAAQGGSSPTCTP